MLYRYTANGEGVFSAGKRLLPGALAADALSAREWIIKPKLPEGSYHFYFTEAGKVMYEQTLLRVHQQYLSNLRCEEIDPTTIGTIIYEDAWQVVTRS